MRAYTQYPIEAMTYLRGLSLELPEGSTYHHATFAGAAVMGAIFYDISRNRVGSPLSPTRREVARCVGDAIIWTDYVDHEIDRAGLSLVESLRFMSDNVDTLLVGEPAQAYAPITPQGRASLLVARSLHEKVVANNDQTDLNIVAHGLVNTTRNQLEASSPEDLLETTKAVGAYIGELAAVIVEMVSGHTCPELRAASRRLGEFADLLDHAYEIDADLAEGAITYATSRIQDNGDSTELRCEVKKVLSEAAHDSYRCGMAALSEKQKPMFRTLAWMIKNKFRFSEKLDHVWRAGRNTRNRLSLATADGLFSRHDSSLK